MTIPQKTSVIRELEESIDVKKAILHDLPGIIVDAARTISKAFQSGNKVLLIGNGGSAADAQHIATELVGHLKLSRKALPAIALTTDSSLLTALANDDGFDTVFSRQIEALADKDDVLLAITTSGNSPNILAAAKTAHAKGMKVIGLTGKSGGNLKNAADLTLIVPSDNTQRIQEAHITIGHIICRLVEDELFQK
jgi:D-sedoheptulose 7-phosphate isomerase